MGEKIERCVLFGGGEIMDYAAVAKRIRPEDYILCADSGYDHCLRLGLTPHRLVGDFDSVCAELPDDIPRLILPAEKNLTDTAYAIELAMEMGCRKMLLTGVLGGRLDHTLGCLNNLVRLTRCGVQTCLTDGRTEVFALTDGGTMTLVPQEDIYFSLIALGDVCEGVDIIGAKYPLYNYTLTNDETRTLSNEFQGEPVKIALRRGTMAVLLVPKD